MGHQALTRFTCRNVGHQKVQTEVSDSLGKREDKNEYRGVVLGGTEKFQEDDELAETLSR